MLPYSYIVKALVFRYTCLLYPSLFPVYFHGRLMSQHTIRTLVGDRENQTIVFGGLSAGGRGAVITIDQIRDLVHPSITIRGLIDSAGYEVRHFSTVLCNL